MDSGGIINKGCNHVDHPANGECLTGWMYTDGEKWNSDTTIKLTCTAENTNPVQIRDKSHWRNTEKENRHIKATSPSSMRKPLEIKELEIKQTPCGAFEMSSEGSAELYQGSRFGNYRLEKNLVNGRVVYFNKEKGQYLFWVNKYDRYWMVRSCISSILVK